MSNDVNNTNHYSGRTVQYAVSKKKKQNHKNMMSFTVSLALLNGLLMLRSSFAIRIYSMLHIFCFVVSFQAVLGRNVDMR